MTLDDLRAYVAVCRAGSFSAVARELGCTQSAVSQHVKRLERETGVPLLERHPRGVVPTAAGRILQEAAADGIGGIDLALRRLGDLVRGDGGGPVRIATGGTTVRHFMAEAIVEFRRRYPQVGLEFRTESSSRNCFGALAAHDLDLAWVTIGPPVRGIEQRPAVELPWVLAVPAGDPLAGRARIEPADLAAARLIRLPENSTSRAQLDAHFAELGIDWADETGVADWDSALLLAELGLGHALVPELPGRDISAERGPRLIPVPSLPPLAVGWAVRRWDALGPLARAFAELVAEGRTPPRGAVVPEPRPGPVERTLGVTPGQVSE